VSEREGHEDREEREDLFEDLDKFFAPIEDVEWPETVEAETAAGTAPSEPQPPESPTQEAAEAVEEIEVVDVEEVAAEPETVFTEEIAATEVPIQEREEGEEEEGVEAFLFAEAEGEEVGEAIVAERLSAPPSYEELPGPGEVEEIVEGIEAAPSEEDLEAAAEHFAASVREEAVEIEPEAPGFDTEPETEIQELLGPTEEEPEGTVPEEPAGVRTVRVGAEDLGGPSWQEPTAVEIGPEVERGGAGRNVQLAAITGLVLAAVAVGAIAIGPGVFAVLAGLVVLVAQGEFYFALQKHHYQPATALGLVTGALVLGAGYYRGEGAMLAMVALGTFASFVWFMTVPAQHRRNVVSNIAITVLGIAWMPLFAGYIMPVLDLPDGRGVVLAILGLTIAYDASAFAVGYFWGSRPLSPAISPKKSWEGAVGATLVVVALAVGVVAPAVDLLDTLPRAVGLAVVVAIFAPLGDLAESLVKRDLGLKDMGSVLPGHGGVLDRIDAMLFVVPVAFLYLRLILV
jgi:phosphatidate cytidylyltransferase